MRHKAQLEQLSRDNEERVVLAGKEHEELCVRLEKEHAEAGLAAVKQHEELKVYLQQHNEGLTNEARKKFQAALLAAQQVRVPIPMW